MSYIIHIETSTNICSVALSHDEEVIFEKVSFDGPSHAALLGVFVEEALGLLKEKNLRPGAVAVSSGPGSYTGLRIGVSLAKGLCFGYNIPLISVPTLEILTVAAIEANKMNSDYLYCPMLDARRMEIYSALYDIHLNPVREIRAEIIDENSYAELLNHQKICFFGNGSDKCKEIIQSKNVFFLENMFPLATKMIPLSAEKYRMGSFEDTAYFEPFYLKEFIATVPRNKVLGNTNG